MATRIGNMRQRFSFQRRQINTGTADGTGDHVADTTWAPVVTLWGELRPISARQAERGDRMVSESDHQLTVRYYADILPEDRVLAVGTSRTFDVTGRVNFDNRGRFWTVYLRERHSM